MYMVLHPDWAISGHYLVKYDWKLSNNISVGQTESRRQCKSVIYIKEYTHGCIQPAPIFFSDLKKLWQGADALPRIQLFSPSEDLTQEKKFNKAGLKPIYHRHHYTTEMWPCSDPATVCTLRTITMKVCQKNVIEVMYLSAVFCQCENYFLAPFLPSLHGKTLKYECCSFWVLCLCLSKLKK